MALTRPNQNLALINAIKQLATTPDRADIEKQLQLAWDKSPNIDVVDEEGFGLVAIATKLYFYRALKWLLNPGWFSSRPAPRFNDRHGGHYELQLAVQYEDLYGDSAPIDIMNKRACIKLLVQKNPNTLYYFNYEVFEKAACHGNLYFLKKYFYTSLSESDSFPNIDTHIVLASLIKPYPEIFKYLIFCSRTNSDRNDFFYRQHSPGTGLLKGLILLISRSQEAGIACHDDFLKRFSYEPFTEVEFGLIANNVNLILELLDKLRGRLQIQKPWQIVSSALNLGANDEDILKLLRSELFSKNMSCNLKECVERIPVAKYLIEIFKAPVTINTLCNAIKKKAPYAHIAYLLGNIDLLAPHNKSHLALETAAQVNDLALIVLLINHGASYSARDTEVSMPENLRCFLILHDCISTGKGNPSVLLGFLKKISAEELSTLEKLFVDMPEHSNYLHNIIKKAEAKMSSEACSSSSLVLTSSHNFWKERNLILDNEREEHSQTLEPASPSCL